jgi:anti-sigma-K factor RskA
VSSNDIDIHHLGAAYALDALDERERMAFESHYPACEVCRADVVAFRDALAHVAAAQATRPPADLRAKVMAEVAVTRQLSPVLPDRVSDLAERRRRRQRAVGGVLAMAAAVVLFVTGALVTRGGDSPAYSDALSEVMREPDARLITLDSGESGGEPVNGVAKVAWSPQGETAVFLADGLAPAPDGSAYELWLIADGQPVPMRVLDAAADGTLRAVVDIDRAPDAWGVTIEPSSGSPAPTGDILFLGTV